MDLRQSRPLFHRTNRWESWNQISRRMNQNQSESDPKCLSDTLPHARFACSYRRNNEYIIISSACAVAAILSQTDAGQISVQHARPNEGGGDWNGRSRVRRDLMRLGCADRRCSFNSASPGQRRKRQRRGCASTSRASDCSSSKCLNDHCCAALPYRRVMNERCFAIRGCARRRSHCCRANFILKSSWDRRKIVSRIPAMTPVSVQKNRRWKKYHAQ